MRHYNDPHRVYFFDTTLRDGEQSPGASMTMETKLLMARQLESLGVDAIEAGFAASSPGDFESIRAIAAAVAQPIVVSLSRTTRSDINQAIKAVEKARRPGVHIFIATSALHMEKKLQMEPEAVLEAATLAVEYACARVPHVEFSAEDATRSDREFLRRVYSAVIKAGAVVCNVPDTVGYIQPGEYRELIEYLREHVIGAQQVTWSAHCHNDLGQAVANSLAAVEAGVRQVECTINGIGERAGNASLAEIVMALHTRYDRYKLATGLDKSELYPTSRFLEKVTGLAIPVNQPIVGKNAFAHEAGIHAAGVIRDAATYEIMDPQVVGRRSNTLVFGKHSGRHQLAQLLEALGLSAVIQDLDDLFRRSKELADKKKDITEDDIYALVAEQLGHAGPFVFVAINGTFNPRVEKSMAIELEVEGVPQISFGQGNGPIDAGCDAINQLTGMDCRLGKFHVDGDSGSDAVANATAEVLFDGVTVIGHAFDTDIVTASLKAYVDGLNKIKLKERVRESARAS